MIKTYKIIILALLAVLPKRNCFEIVEENIEENKVTDKICNCHSIVIKRLSTVRDKFLFNERLNNEIIIPTIHTNIKVTSHINFKLDVPFCSANSTSIYQIMHKNQNVSLN